MQRSFRQHPLTVGIAQAIAFMVYAGRMAASLSVQSQTVDGRAPKRESLASTDVAKVETRVLAATQICKKCFLVFLRSCSECPECHTPGMKPKRIRVRGPKLYACDLEIGGVYVPKRGNDKTPNFYITSTANDNDEVSDVPTTVYWRRVGDDVSYPPNWSTAEEFLNLVARRVS